MVADGREQPTTEVAYVLADSPEWEAAIAQRTVAGPWSSFLLPHLSPGMTMLDCGSGPGSITIGFADAVAPGEVFGIDVQASQVEMATALAAERGVKNVRFLEGSIYELPWPDGTFDAVFAAQVLIHLGDPLAAVREMHRVLKPGGIAALADGDMGPSLMAPLPALIAEMYELEHRVRQHLRGDRFHARNQRAILREAGFVRTEASVEALGGSEVERLVRIRKLRFLSPSNIETAIKQGWADQAKLDAMVHALESWGEHPDAFYCLTFCRTIGWKAE